MKARELKLVFAEQDLGGSVFDLFAGRRTIGNHSFDPVRREEICDLYFDTASRDLQRRRASMRLRHSRGSEGALQVKRAHGDVAIEMEYSLSSVGCHWNAELGSVVPTGETLNAIEEIGVQGEFTRIGKIEMLRHLVAVSRSGVDVGSICLDRFRVQRDGSPREVETSEIEVKGLDAREIQFLGESLANWFGLIRVTSSKLDRNLPPEGGAERLLLDMDPGVDDALALLYLLASPDRPQIDGITIVGGNVSLRQCARNAFRICRWAQQKGLIAEIPRIGLGADLSGGRDDASNVHGPDGMGGLGIWSAIDREFESFRLDNAWDLQREVLLAHPGEVTAVATGPCSNLARLIDTYPEALAAACEIIVMGGAFFDCGNRGPRAEFNIHSDSASASRVVKFCRATPCSDRVHRFIPLSFVGLDVTHRVVLERGTIHAVNTELGRLAAEISSKYMEFYRLVLGVDGCPLHDPLAMAVALHPELVVREPYHVEIVSVPESPEVDGITIADHRPCSLFKDREKEVTEVAVSVNGAAFLEDFLNTIANAV